ncbi:MAG: fumarylacetoacetate hydrolase family protein [Anaerolineae bacterium]|nr:fumarylacetoacetate hydrolase family protein [Anaerolineae bacterium]
MAQLIRFFVPDAGIRIGLRQDDQLHDVTEYAGSISAWLRRSVGRVPAAIDDLIAHAATLTTVYDPADLGAPGEMGLHWLPPVDTQEVWAAGVTYTRSREARQEEAIDGGDIYARVYEAQRPELFFKSPGAKVIGPLGQVGIRSDSAWNVPEPELALVMNPALEMVGLTVGNDVSSRDIEGANPLYLPQAKVYTASCALGPGIVLGALATWPAATITLTIERDQQVAFSGTVHTDQIHRPMADLIAYLGRSNTYPDGVVLLTGTGIVPPSDFTLARGDVTRITIEGIGELVNTVKVV